MSDTYYEYRDVGVMIAHRLMKMDGWKVYGYKPDNSDPMTDYWDPANWGGVAEKNGYVFCFHVRREAKPQEIREYNYSSFSYDKSIMDKIEKLKQMTVSRGASEQEEQSAKSMIIRLQRKAEETQENSNKYIVTGVIPGHMANPPRMNWHIEKDGIIVSKGNGVLKYAKVDDYYSYPKYIKDMEDFRTMPRIQYKEKLVQEYMWRWNDSEERANEHAESHIKDMGEKQKLIAQFEDFINKIDTTCGGLLGKGDVYEKVTVTEYKTELKAVETPSGGAIKEGQLFTLKGNFSYGCRKGLVYRIHESVWNGKKVYHAYKLNGKLTKECTGKADSSNYWFIGNADDGRFLKWVEKGVIAWCELQEVKTPYEVEKVVKRITTKSTEKSAEKTAEKPSSNGYTYSIKEDVDTRDNSKIWVVKVNEKLGKEEYISVNKYMRSVGGYYSKFKHGFLFRENPKDKLNE